MKLLDWQTMKYLARAPKVVLRLAVCEPGPYFELVIERWYNARSLVGKPRRRGQFVAGWSSDLYREYAAIVGKPSRCDRLAISSLSDKLLIGTVDTVKCDRTQQPLHHSLHYSVVRQLKLGST